MELLYLEQRELCRVGGFCLESQVSPWLAMVAQKTLASNAA